MYDEINHSYSANHNTRIPIRPTEKSNYQDISDKQIPSSVQEALNNKQVKDVPNLVSEDGNQPPRLMCYWCSINIAQQRDSQNSGPNFMPSGFNLNDPVDADEKSSAISRETEYPTVQKLRLVHQKVLKDGEDQFRLETSEFRRAPSVNINRGRQKFRNGDRNSRYGGLKVNSIADIRQLQPTERESKRKLSGRFNQNIHKEKDDISEVEVLKLIPSFLNPHLLPSKQRPLITKFNQIYSQRQDKRREQTKTGSGPFFNPRNLEKPLTKPKQDTINQSTDLQTSDQVNLSKMLSVAYPRYLAELSSVHDLYPSSRSSNARALSKIDISQKLLQSHPLHTFLTSVDPLLLSEIHQIEPEELTELVIRPQPLLMESEERISDGEVANEQVKNSLLLDAWWRLRLYLHVGHGQPWD